MGGDRGRGGGARPGWGTVAPCPGGGLTSASARHDSPQGTIAGHWRLTDDDLALTVGTPPGTEAGIRLPGAAPTLAGPGTSTYEIRVRQGRARP
ncbi:alpha-L-rhamnosidase C-terminal domain-containing protein [Streptomyces sp. SLBN-31]|uniref:alpha-L-rhamnosidase C-terminal domain-containing protein n=1 Tax=Streptomyces sp. SLBN-31 TaxID=2768444 RepID=UPI00114F5420